MLKVLKQIFCFLLFIVWTSGLIFVFYQSAHKTHEYAKHHIKIADPPPLSTLSPKLVNILTLGHKSLYEDFLQIWLIQIVADPRLSSAYLQDFLQTVGHIIKHQPKIESIYMLSCFTLSEKLKRPDLCQPISIAGLKAIPKSWRISMMQGWIHAFRTDEPEQAAVFYSIAATRTDIKASEWVKALVQKLSQKQKLSEQDLEKSLDMLFESSDTKLKEMFFQQQENQGINEIKNKN